MSAKISFQRSSTQAFIQSACKARETGVGTASTYQVVAAFVPVWGWGKHDVSKFNFAKFSEETTLTQSGYNYEAYGLGFVDSWPNVYTTLTEVWSIGTYPIFILTSTWSPYCDVGLTVVRSGLAAGSGYPFTPGTLNSVTVNSDGTVLSVSYDANQYYTATLSGGGSADWAALTAQALTLLADAGIPAGPANSTTMIYPVSTTPGYATTTSYGETIVCAAAYGAGLRFDISGSGGPFANGNEIYGMAASIMDWPTAFNVSDMCPNQGGVICVKSAWQFNGADHNNIYAQPLTLDMTGVPSLGAVIGATSIPSASQPLPGPNGAIPPWPWSMTFAPSDAAAASGTTYGLLGFRSPPA